MGSVGLRTSPDGRHRARAASNAGARRRIRSAAVALGCALLVSCGEDASRVAPRNLSPTASRGTPIASPAALSNAARLTPAIGEIVWAAANDPVTNAPTETVATYTIEALRITASVPLDALPTGSTIEARWEYNDTSLDAFTSQIVTSAPASRRWVSFHLDRDPETLWPTGVYDVTISLNGAVVQRAAIEIARAE